MKEVKIRFICFSVCFWKLWVRQGCISFYGSHKGGEGADTDLMFQFCLPNVHSFHGFNISTNASGESQCILSNVFFLNWHLKNFLHCYSGSKFLWGGRLWQFDTRVLRSMWWKEILYQGVSQDRYGLTIVSFAPAYTVLQFTQKVCMPASLDSRL